MNVAHLVALVEALSPVRLDHIWEFDS